MNSRHLDTAHAATVSGIDYITERTDMFIIAQTYRSIFFWTDEAGYNDHNLSYINCSLYNLDCDFKEIS